MKKEDLFMKAYARFLVAVYTAIAHQDSVDGVSKILRAAINLLKLCGYKRVRGSR